MRIRTFLAVLSCVAASLALAPAFAEPAAPAPAAPALQPCPADAQGMKVAQLSCCKAHKGICGCRAGKIVCCDNTVSTEPGCTCRGDDGVVE